jgi:hypothetical protein
VREMMRSSLVRRGMCALSVAWSGVEWSGVASNAQFACKIRNVCFKRSVEWRGVVWRGKVALDEEIHAIHDVHVFQARIVLVQSQH